MRKIIVIDKIRKSRDVQRKIIKMMLQWEWRKEKNQLPENGGRWRLMANKNESKEDSGINYGKKRKERKIR